MRRYPHNSPHSAARIVALTLLADGDLTDTELALLDELSVHAQLGLEHAELQAVIDDFCADLLASKQLNWAGECPVDEYTLAALMAEIDDPLLRRKVLSLCVQLAQADDSVARGGSIVLIAAVEHWGLHHYMLRHTKTAQLKGQNAMYL